MIILDPHEKRLEYTRWWKKKHPEETKESNRKAWETR